MATLPTRAVGVARIAVPSLVWFVFQGAGASDPTANLGALVESVTRDSIGKYTVTLKDHWASFRCQQAPNISRPAGDALMHARISVGAPGNTLTIETFDLAGALADVPVGSFVSGWVLGDSSLNLAGV